MSGSEWLAASGVVAAIIAGVFTYAASRRASNRMAQLEARKLDGEEFDRNRAITDSIITELRKEVDRLKAQVQELTLALQETRSENQSLQQLLREMTATANSLRHQIRVLEKQLNGA